MERPTNKFHKPKLIMALSISAARTSTPLPWWTWVAPLPVFMMGDYLSQLTTSPSGLIVFYFPIAIGIILVHWWGPRVIIGLVISVVITDQTNAAKDHAPSILAAIEHGAPAFTSWILFSYLGKGKVWLPDLQQTLRFLLLGIAVPLIANSLVILGSVHVPDLLVHVLMIWTADFTSSLVLVLPVLYFITPLLERQRLTVSTGSHYVSPRVTYRMIRPHQKEIIISILALALMSYYVPVEKFWYLYSAFALYISVRFGFSNSLLANLVVFFFVYIFPMLGPPRLSLWTLESDLINVHLGILLHCTIAVIVGRLMSDLRIADVRLTNQYRELERANQELDRFVYSASHDLSAPLKSVLGLINISRMEPDRARLNNYLNQMEKSIQKLDGCIHEILDYSRNARLDTSPEKIDLPELTKDVIDNLQFMENVHQIQFNSEDHEIYSFEGDKMRVRIILNNLLSNAIKYQRLNNGHIPTIHVRSRLTGDNLVIEVEDNGRGIPGDVIGSIFKMFFRGTLESKGSGLGLYIAKEAAQRMGGGIEVKSTFNEGSTFTLWIPRTSIHVNGYSNHSFVDRQRNDIESMKMDSVYK